MLGSIAAAAAAAVPEDVVGLRELTSFEQQQRGPYEDRERTARKRDSNQRTKRPRIEVDRITTGRDCSSSIDG